jgi:hypothetical protein
VRDRGASCRWLQPARSCPSVGTEAQHHPESNAGGKDPHAHQKKLPGDATLTTTPSQDGASACAGLADETSATRRQSSPNGAQAPAASTKSERAEADCAAPMGRGATATLERLAASLGQLSEASPRFAPRSIFPRVASCWLCRRSCSAGSCVTLPNTFTCRAASTVFKPSFCFWRSWRWLGSSRSRRCATTRRASGANCWASTALQKCAPCASAQAFGRTGTGVSLELHAVQGVDAGSAARSRRSLRRSCARLPRHRQDATHLRPRALISLLNFASTPALRLRSCFNS